MTCQLTNTQYSMDPSLVSLENVFGSYCLVPMAIEIPDAINKDDGEDSNVEIKGNESDDSTMKWMVMSWEMQPRW